MNQSERNKRKLVVPMKRKALENCADGNQWRGRSRNESLAGLCIQIQFPIKISMDYTSHLAGRFLWDGRFRCIRRGIILNELDDYENKISCRGLYLLQQPNGVNCRHSKAS